ncbi:MAG: arylesterase [Rhodobacteraceae bacterium]|nr:arylesterase [Paracoccaceae bacterium]
MRKMLMSLVLIWCGFSATAEPITIVALGDSLTQGYGLQPKDGFVPQLQRWLTEQGADVVLINAGVSGDTTTGGAARVDWTLTPDVDAMIVALGGNDLLRGIDPGLSRKNINSILAATQAAGVPALLVGMPAPPNYGADYKTAFDSIFPELAGAYGVALFPSFMAGIGDGTNPADMLQYLQDDGLHPNPEGVALIVAAMGPSVLELIAQVTAGG